MDSIHPRNPKMAIQRSFSCCVSLVALIVFKDGHSTDAQSVARHLSFAPENQTSYLPLVPRRLGSTPWTNVTNPLVCARQSLSMYPDSRGFLYNSGSGLCRPVLWLQGPTAQGAQQVLPAEGDLYLSSGICGSEFTIMEFGTSGELACLKYVHQSLVTMAQATSHCQTLGSHLVHVKTLPKLELIRSFATAEVWVGFKYLRAEGYHVWVGDGQRLTSQEKLDVFPSGEPNDQYGGEDCGNFYPYVQMLNDVGCDEKYNYVCERDLAVFSSD